MSSIEDALAMFSRGYGCSQAVLLAHSAQFGLDEDEALRIASGFPGGMLVGQACGAATGAFMVLGLALCGSDCSTPEGRAPVAAAVATFSKRFGERVGALNCPDILGCDVRTPEGVATAQEEDLFATRCPPAILAASEILRDMLLGTRADCKSCRRS